MRKLLIASMLASAAMTGQAFAQTTTPETTPGAAPAAPMEGEATTGDAAAGMAEGGFMTYQQGDQMLGSGLMGADVWGAEGESIGSVDDLLLDRDGQVIAVIVGVGGFLGIGQKDVAISNDQLEFVLSQDAAAADGTQPTTTAPAGGTAVAPADPAAPAAGVPADPAVPTGDATATAPAAPATQPADPATAPAAGQTTAPAAGTTPAGTMTGMDTGWGWSGAGIERIEVAYTREQLEAAPEFESVE